MRRGLKADVVDPWSLPVLPPPEPPLPLAASPRPEVMPTGIRRSPALLKTMRLLARRATVACMSSTLAWKLGWSSSMVTTSGVPAGTDFLLGRPAEPFAEALSEDEDRELELRS